ncbi:MAG: hypothetical protein LUH16_05420 [Clostridiales bacterium]|nr:hypothetical protein [Clostridiales bacterium]
MGKDDCIYIANLAIDALSNGHHTREVEKAMRAIRMAYKALLADEEDNAAKYNLGTIFVKGNSGHRHKPSSLFAAKRRPPARDERTGRQTK